MAKASGHTATIGAPSTAQKIARDLARHARLTEALPRAEGERKKAIEAELTAIDAGLGGENVRKALQEALAAEAERTRPERERAAKEKSAQALEAAARKLREELAAAPGS